MIDTKPDTLEAKPIPPPPPPTPNLMKNYFTKMKLAARMCVCTMENRRKARLSLYWAHGAQSVCAILKLEIENFSSLYLTMAFGARLGNLYDLRNGLYWKSIRPVKLSYPPR